MPNPQSADDKGQAHRDGLWMLVGQLIFFGLAVGFWLLVWPPGAWFVVGLAVLRIARACY